VYGCFLLLRVSSPTGRARLCMARL
jgi:hypothetical protein